MCSTMVGGGWRLAVGGGWRLAVGNWQLVAVGGGWRRLEVGDWWLVAVGSGWQLAVGRSWRLAAVGGWRLVAVGGWWRLAVDGSWRLAVGGPLGLSLRAVLSKKKKIWSLKDRPASPNVRLLLAHVRCHTPSANCLPLPSETTSAPPTPAQPLRRPPVPHHRPPQYAHHCLHRDKGTDPKRSPGAPEHVPRSLRRPRPRQPWPEEAEHPFLSRLRIVTVVADGRAPPFVTQGHRFSRECPVAALPLRMSLAIPLWTLTDPQHPPHVQ